MNSSNQSTSSLHNNSSQHPSSSNSSTSYPHVQYNGLLSTVNDLRQDLEKALNKLVVYEEQNTNLSSNYAVIKDELIDTRKKYNEIKENYLMVVVQKAEMEKHNEEFLMNIKVQLTEKTREFELQREKFKPQDIDSIKIKIQEELEFSHQIQLSNVRKEVDQYKELYYNMKNENSLLKVECDMKCSTLQRQVDNANEKYMEVDAFMHNKMKEWSDNRHQLQKDEVIRNQSIKIHELQSIIGNMKDECNNYHSKYENTIKDSEIMNSKHIQMINDLKGRLKLIESEKFTSDEKLKYMHIDIDKKDMNIKLLKIQVDEYKEKNEVLQHEFDDVLAQHHQNLELQHQHEECVTMKHDSQVNSLMNELNSIHDKNNNREDMIKKLQRQLSDIQSRYEANEREIRRNQLQQVQGLQKRNTIIESELASTKKDLHTHVYQSNIQLESIKAENDVQRSEISRLKREKDVLHEKLRDADRRGSQLSSFESSINEYKLKDSKLQKELGQLRMKLRDMERTYESLVIKHDLLGREYSSSMETINQETKQRLATLQSSYKNKISELQEKLKVATSLKSKVKNDLDREKRRCELYKEKALQAHNQNKLLAGIVAGDDALESIDF